MCNPDSANSNKDYFRSHKVSLSGSAGSATRILLTNEGETVWTNGGKRFGPLQVMDYLMIIPWERGSHVECVVDSICVIVLGQRSFHSGPPSTVLRTPPGFALGL